MHAHSPLSLTALLALLPLAAGVAAAAPPQSILVLDASGSMWGQIEGRAKIAIAREAVGTMLGGWSDGDIGLMAYGHRRKGDCADIELLIEPGPMQAEAIRQQVQALNPVGMTPISASVRQAATLLRFTEQKATVILVSDGEETCNADPCELGAELERAGVDFTAHVIGFDIRAGSTAEAQLRFTVTDSGIGIPDEDLPHLFEPFHRAKNVGTLPGTGLGLAIVKKAVDLHGGRIEVSSAPGQGSRFDVTLPR